MPVGTRNRPSFASGRRLTVRIRKAGRGYQDPLDVYSNANAAHVRAVTRAALKSFAAGVPLAAILRSLASGDVAEVMAALNWEAMTNAMAPVTETLLSQAIRAAERATRDLGFGYDPTHAAALRWAEQEAGRLIGYISDGARAAISDLVARAIRDGLNPYDIAPLIRDLIGLHPRYAGAVYSYWAGLVNGGVMSDARIAAAVQAYYNRLLMARAENIARTEVLAAANAGKLAGYFDGILNGWVTPGAGKEWIAGPDDRTCPECADLDGTVILLDDFFNDTYDAPPAHGSCRCTTALVPANEMAGVV